VTGRGTIPFRTSLRLNNDLATTTFVELAVAAEEAGFDQPTTCSCAPPP
jgi:hypothetical protein